MENNFLSKKVPGFFSCRYGMSLILHFCNMVIVTQRVCLSLTMVVMVNNTQSLTNVSSEANPRSTMDPVYNWSPDIQGFILSSNFYGALVVQIPIGYYSGIYSVKKIIACGLLLSSVCTLCTPLAAQVGATLVIVCRVVQGMAQGTVLSGQHQIWTRWAPPLEQGRLTTISASGAMLGPFIVLLVTGFICELLGWISVFYIFGACGCVVCIFWLVVFYDDPKDHPCISNTEKNYITSSLAQVSSSSVTTLPIKAMLQSLPVWAIAFCNFAIVWAHNFFITYNPIFINSVLDVNVRENGFLSGLPFLFAFIITILGGQMADFCLSRNIFSTITVRKVFTTLGMVCPIVFSICLLYLSFNFLSTVIFLILSQATAFLALSGVNINVLDIAPRYYGFLRGVTTLTGMLGGMISSTISGLILNADPETPWYKIYLMIAAINGLALVFYLIFAKAEIQNWAKDSQETRL
nr:sodium-dependent phosphate transport protein 1 [Cavia porcellus]XP_013006869.1 sodium-dependent phosphate transport protein 1 [Cavia porcellus]